MKKSIVFKWFVLTASLFLALLLVVGIMQSYFFERFYVERKTASLKTHSEAFLVAAAQRGQEAASLQFYRDHGVWLLELDEYGQMLGVESYYIEVELKDAAEAVWRIPLYPFQGNFTEVPALLKRGDAVIIDAVQSGAVAIPYQIQTSQAGIINFSIANKLHGPTADAAYSHLDTVLYQGTVTSIVAPEQVANLPFPYGERFFLEQLKTFQVGLLAGDAQTVAQCLEYSVAENLVSYRISVRAVSDRPGYIFAMTSLQPVDEAVAAMWQFYPYLFSLALICALLPAFALIKWLSGPLLAINRVMGKLAIRDFSEKLPVYSNDEIGQLSTSVNFLARQMESYIADLEQDLAGERRLETTRREFIAGVSHELKTPLAVMKSCLSILQDGIAAAKTEHYFQALQNELQRMDALIINMLDLAKFESGTYQPEFSVFEMDEVVTSVCASFSEQMREKGVVLQTELHSVSVIGHRLLISRVVANFISNAIGHTAEGGVIFVRIKPSEEQTEISVTNQGPPIAEDELEKVWQQFYRVAEHSAQPGSGLGLSIAKSILNLHGASYGVMNTDDGVRFFFVLRRSIERP